MAISITWDQVADAQVEQHVRNGTRIVRVGLVEGLTSAVTTSSKAILDAVGHFGGAFAASLAFGFQHPDYTDALLTFRVARAVENAGGTKARVWAHFETPGNGGAPIERFAIRDTGTLIAEPTEVAPGTAKQLICSTTSSSPNYDHATQRDTERPITANFPRNMRAIQLYGLFADRPPLALLNAGNTVNHATWQGRGRGYWRMDPPDVTWSSRDGLYRVSVSALSKGTRKGEDWSTYEIPIDPATGHKTKVADTDLQALYNQSYEPGLRSDKNGIWKWGFYEVSNLSALLGDTFGN